MKLDYIKIAALFESKGFGVTKAGEALGMSHTGYAAMMKNKSMKLETLIKMAEYFKKPLEYFFEDFSSSEAYQIVNAPVDVVNEVANTTINPKKRICTNPECIEKIAELEKKIARYEKIIDDYQVGKEKPPEKHAEGGVESGPRKCG